MTENVPAIKRNLTGDGADGGGTRNPGPPSPEPTAT